MDPVTAAGIGLSVTSLSFQLFSGCITGYQLLIDAADMPKRVKHLQVRLRLEKMRFVSWGDQIGLRLDALEESSLVLRLHHSLISDILSQVSDLFMACLKLEKRFSTTVEPSTDNLDGHYLENNVSSYGLSANSLLAKTARSLQRISGLPKRLEWAAVKQEKFENLIEQLISYNNSMQMLLDSASLQQINQAQLQSGLTLLQLSSDVDELKRLARAVRIQPAADGSLSEDDRAPAQLHSVHSISNSLPSDEQYLGLARLANFKAAHLDMGQSPSSMDDLAIDIDDVHVVESTSRIDLATYRGDTVWIEWKEFDQENRNPWYEGVLGRRVQKLVTLLNAPDAPEVFRKPECIGYVREIEDDMIRYGLINKVPSGVSTVSPPRSLLSLIKHEQSPSLSLRIKLACALASSLMHLHSVNWLHKGFRSENIIFFPETGGKVAYDTPTISGFDYARPDEAGEMTEKPQSTIEQDIYRHPYSIDHPRARSRKSWDIYGLGVALVEIATWKSIDAVAGIDLRDQKAKSRVRRMREFLLSDDFLSINIGVPCGDRYQEVVTRCLTGGHRVGADADADESDPQTGSEMIRVFAREIVGVLESIQI